MTHASALSQGSQRSLEATTSLDSTSPATERLRVLLLDADVTAAHEARRSIEGFHDVVVASSGDEAARALEDADAFDAVLCDLSMWRAYLEAPPDVASRFVFVIDEGVSARRHPRLCDLENDVVEKPLSACTIADVTRPRRVRASR